MNRVVDLIQAASGLEDMDLCGRKVTMDFTQFMPRGHYTKSDLLKYYFRIMMWCGRVEFCITPCPDMKVTGTYGKNCTAKRELEEQSIRELGTSLMLLRILKSANKLEAWRNFDTIIKLIVGKSDNMTFSQLGK